MLEKFIRKRAAFPNLSESMDSLISVWIKISTTLISDNLRLYSNTASIEVCHFVINFLI